MKKNCIIVLFGLLFHSCAFQQPYIKAFTHPFDLDEISVYSKPDIFHSYLQADEEAGWIVEIYNQDTGYLYVKLPEECDFPIKDVWVKSEDIGIIVQNYDSVKIPVYLLPDTSSNSITHLYTSTIGVIYGIKENLVLLGIKEEDNYIKGWIEKQYLCGNPYTTCN